MLHRRCDLYLFFTCVVEWFEPIVAPLQNGFDAGDNRCDNGRMALPQVFIPTSQGQLLAEMLTVLNSVCLPAPPQAPPQSGVAGGIQVGCGATAAQLQHARAGTNSAADAGTQPAAQSGDDAPGVCSYHGG